MTSVHIVTAYRFVGISQIFKLNLLPSLFKTECANMSERDGIKR